MKKSGIIGLTALTTLGLAVGATAIAVNLPEVKDNLNISYNGHQIIGVDKPSETPPAEMTDISTELNKLGYVTVEYMTAEDTFTTVIQKKGSGIERHNIPTKSGHVFLGWSTTEDGSNMIANVDSPTKLYPVFVPSSSEFITIYTDTKGSMAQAPIATFGLDGYAYSSLNSHTYPAGISTSPDEIKLTNEIDYSQPYYAVFYCEETDQIYSLKDIENVRAFLDYGDTAFYDITVHVADGTTFDGQFKDFNLWDYSINIDMDSYFPAGLTTTPDSKEITVYDNSQYADGGEYYIVYSGPSGELSYNEMKAIYEASLSIDEDI